MLSLTPTPVAGAAEVRAATAPYCPESGVCFRWGVVGPAARSGDGVVYFPMQAPADYSWIGLGTGSQMQGSDMFVVYAAADANVTLSTRAGTGHNMPQYAPRSDVRIVEGSGVRDGLMTANIRCSGCDNLDLGSATPWIAAWSRGNRLGSGSPAERISKHDGYDSFSVDLVKAAVSADRNPFTGPDAGGADAVLGGTGQEKSGPSLGDVHGILMAVIFLIGYPLGSTLMPLVGSWILHASWQMVIFAAMWVGFGIGYVTGTAAGSWSSVSSMAAWG